jgi:phospholipid/cholesterol/gamma-HCH transport system substrate-binding protein
MKKYTENKIRLGIFVSIGLTLFITGIYFIGKKQQLFSSTFLISSVFKDISGLQVGNNVRFSGINVGIIEYIEQITDSTVKVDMLIDERSRKFIKKNARAVIGTDGLMGSKILIIVPGTGSKQVIANNDTLGATHPVSIDDILLKIKVSSDNAAKITDGLAAIIGNIREGKGTVGKLFMDSVLAENLDEAIVNIKQGAGGFRQNMDAAGKNILLKGFLKKKKNTQGQGK